MATLNVKWKYQHLERSREKCIYTVNFMAVCGWENQSKLSNKKVYSIFD